MRQREGGGQVIISTQALTYRQTASDWQTAQQGLINLGFSLVSSKPCEFSHRSHWKLRWWKMWIYRDQITSDKCVQSLGIGHSWHLFLCHHTHFHPLPNPPKSSNHPLLSISTTSVLILAFLILSFLWDGLLQFSCYRFALPPPPPPSSPSTMTQMQIGSPDSPSLGLHKITE
jgi:hypothetical protein